jgi:hypothetical protein
LCSGGRRSNAAANVGREWYEEIRALKTD